MTPEIRAAAADLLPRVNTFLEWARSPGLLRSGWRPAAVNAQVPGAAPASLHISGHAVDISDVDQALADFCIANLNLLIEGGLWMEDPRCTPNWVHLQSVEPKSKLRVFIPNAFWASRLADQPKFA